MRPYEIWTPRIFTRVLCSHRHVSKRFDRLLHASQTLASTTGQRMRATGALTGLRLPHLQNNESQSQLRGRQERTYGTSCSGLSQEGLLPYPQRRSSRAVAPSWATSAPWSTRIEDFRTMRNEESTRVFKEVISTQFALLQSSIVRRLPRSIRHEQRKPSDRSGRSVRSDLYRVSISAPRR